MGDASEDLDRRSGSITDKKDAPLYRGSFLHATKTKRLNQDRDMIHVHKMKVTCRMFR